MKDSVISPQSPPNNATLAVANIFFVLNVTEVLIREVTYIIGFDGWPKINVGLLILL